MYHIRVARVGKVLPDIDERCGSFYRYRDFSECSAAWQRSKVANVPQVAETFHWIRELCSEVLEPVTKQFGELNLTYGFSSAALSRQIRKGIAPKLDQHVGYELNTKGDRICPRGGFAADFKLKNTSSLVVAQWVARNTAFDRLYYFGQDRSLHVSIAPAPIGQIVMMGVSSQGHPLPRVVKKDTFLELSLE